MKYILIGLLIAGTWTQTEQGTTGEAEAPGDSGGFVDDGGSSDVLNNWNLDPTGDNSGEDLFGPENDSLVDPELSDAEKLKLGFERQTVQPDWIRRFGIVSLDIKNRMASSEDFVETVSSMPLVAFDSENENKEHHFVLTFLKASDWVFVTFEDADSGQKHEFFFPYSALAQHETIYLRELLEECVKPVTIVPEPPTVAKCHYFYKKVSEAYDFAVKEVGPTDGADLMECYIESVKKMTRQPRVEILCVEGGIEDSQYKRLTREQYDHIKANHNDLGNGTFEGDLEETEVTKVEAK